MGIGLYRDSVYVGLRNRFHLMADSLQYLPSDVNDDVIEERYYLARGTFVRITIVAFFKSQLTLCRKKT